MITTLYECFRHWSANGSVWLYSDPHFNDKDLEAGISGRPAADELVKRINSCVHKSDTLIILGDIGDIECVKRIRGYKVLIAGNHDSGLANYKDVFDEVYGGPLIISDKIILSHEPLTLPFMYNIHGHNHMGNDDDALHLNVCADVINYTPISLKEIINSGCLSKIDSIHRQTIDTATARRQRRLERGEKR